MRVRAELQRALQQRGSGAGTETAVEKWPAPIRDDSRGIEIIFRAQAVARWARAIRRIKTKRAWLELRHGYSPIGTGQLFGKNVVLAPAHRNRHHPARKLERRGDRLLQPRAEPLLDQQAG